MASIGELFIELGVKTDTAAINKVGDGVKKLRTNLLLTAGAFTGAIAGLDRFVNSALKGVVALQNMNAQTGLSIEKLQQFQQAGQLSNLALSADQIAQSIGNVQKNLAQIKIGQGNIAPFQLLGIDVAGADAFDVIDQLRDSIKGIDPAIATNLVSQLGLTPDFINILKLSRKEFEALGKNTFLNKRQRADIDKVGTSIKALTLRFKALKDQAVAKIAPQLNDLVQKFFKWMKDNGEKIVNVISSIARGFAKFASAIGNAFDISSRFIESIFGLENGIKVLAIAFGFLTLSFSPFLAGLAAIILILDDIAVFRRGGKSLIGDLVEGFKDLPDFAKILGGATLVAGIAKISGSIGLLGKAIRGLSGLSVILNPITAFLAAATLFANSPEIGEKLGKIADETEAGQKVGNAGLAFQEVAESGGGFFTSLAAAALAFTSQKNVDLAPTLSNTRNNENISVTNNFEINGVQEPKAVAAEVDRVQRTITQESLNRVRVGQGNVIK
jgi:hypothetical protein